MYLSLLKNALYSSPSAKAIGLVYSHKQTVSPEKAAFYTDTISCTLPNTRHPQTISPFYISAMASPGILKLLQYPQLKANLLIMVHAQQELSFFSPVFHDLTVHFEHRVATIEKNTAGNLLTIETKAWNNESGSLLCFSKAGFIFRTRKTSKGKVPSSHTAQAESSNSIDIHIPDNLALQFAKASGDTNPIHTNAVIAKLAGFKRPILQGMCTLGLAYSQLSDKLLSNDSFSAHSISGRFSGIVYPGENVTLTTQKNVPQTSETRFDITSMSGKTVIKNGSFCITAQYPETV